MLLRTSIAARYAPLALAMLLPVVLIYSALRTFQELDQLKEVFLRNRSAAIAARLEVLPHGSPEELDTLLDQEPGLKEIQVIADRTDPALAPLWSGQELFRAGLQGEGSGQVYRVYLPFHQEGALRIARIDLDARSADFLLVHARHNVGLASVSGAVMVALATFALWTIRRAAAEEKRRLELTHLAHLGKLSAVLAHEIRTPLATIKGFTQLAMEQADSRTQPILTPVLRETERLENLVSDLLLYGRPPQPVLTECNWQDVVSGLPAATCRLQMSAPGFRLRTDANLLRQVLANLIRNACEALGGQADGFVTLTAKTEGADVLLIVEDNGPGISEEQRERVFESFFTTKSFGTGLGLPIAASLARALHGALQLGAREGGGVRAEVRLCGAALAAKEEVTT